MKMDVCAYMTPFRLVPRLAHHVYDDAGIVSERRIPLHTLKSPRGRNTDEKKCASIQQKKSTKRNHD